VFSDLRAQAYADYRWPSFLAPVLAHNGLAASLIATASLILFLLGAFLLVEPAALFGRHAGDFYAVIPYNAMIALFGLVALYVIVALVMGFRGFWRETGETMGDFASGRAFWQGMGAALSLRYLEGGSGDGCTYPHERPSQARRWYHHLTFYGFILCFAATCVATVYHYALGWIAPYPFLSLPVVLGTLAGIGPLVGPAGLSG
jgi:citrate/tricarballylate utilization protein